MPLFRYKAQDAQGRDVEGSIAANDVQAAQSTITRRGLRLFTIAEASQAPPTVAAPKPAAPAVRPPSVAPPNVRPPQVNTPPQAPAYVPPQTVAAPRQARSYEPSRRNASTPVQPIQQDAQAQSTAGNQAYNPNGPLRINTIQDPPIQIRRTKRGSPKSVAFIFNQLASYFNAGLNPAEALETLANQQPNQLYRESLLEAAKATQEGSRFSRILERYPDLYRPHVAGMVRAGEMAGYLPEAVKAVAEQAESARKIGGWQKFLGWWIVGHALALVPCWLMIKFANDDMDAQFKSGGTANTGHVFLQSAGHTLLWPVAPLMLGMLGAVLWFNYWLMDSERSRFRDRLQLMVPAIGKRARSESLAIFSWTLSMVSRAGIPPKAAMELAIGAMPNTWMQHQLRLVQAQMQDGTRLSEAVANVKFLPDEYGAILQTGELTGDVSSALMTVSGASTDEFQRNDKAAMIRIFIWIVLVMIIATGIAAFYVIHDFYPHMIETASSPD